MTSQDTQAGRRRDASVVAGRADHGPDPMPGDVGSRTGLRRAGTAAWALIGIAGVIVIAGFVLGRLTLLVIPLILALFPATLLVPVSTKLKTLGAPDSLAAFASILLGIVVIAGIIGAMVPLVVAGAPDLVESASSGVEEIESFLEDDPFGLGLQGPSDLLQAGREQLGELGDYTGQAMTAATTAFEFIAGLLLLFVILFFYLKDGSRLTRGIVSLAPRDRRAGVLDAANRAWDTLGRYFRGQMLVALVDAVFIGIGLVVLGVPLAAPLAVLIFFGALFPLVGAVVTGALAVLVGLADGGLTTALLVLGLILLVQQLEGNILQPFILGRAISLHPLVVLLSVTAGGVTLGILGAFLAVPVVAIVARVLSGDGDFDLTNGGAGQRDQRAEGPDPQEQSSAARADGPDAEGGGAQGPRSDQVARDGGAAEPAGAASRRDPPDAADRGGAQAPRH